MSSKLKTPHPIWPEGLVALSGLAGFVHASIRRLGKALWTQRLKTHLIIWPVALMAIGGLNRFAEGVSKSIGDILGSQTLYPARTSLTILASIYLILAIYAIWNACKSGTESARRASAD
jgi:hypothetical protein